MKEPEIIAFVIEGENIIVTNPCTIPVDLMKESLAKERKKGEISACCMIKLPIGLKGGIK